MWMAYQVIGNKGRVLYDIETDLSIKGLNQLQNYYNEGWDIDGFVSMHGEKIPFKHEDVPTLVVKYATVVKVA